MNQFIQYSLNHHMSQQGVKLHMHNILHILTAILTNNKQE
jgi:hypothetical protein